MQHLVIQYVRTAFFLLTSRIFSFKVIRILKDRLEAQIMPKAKAQRSSGRPLLPENKRKTRISISLSKDSLRKIDVARGKTSRSKFIQSTFEADDFGHAEATLQEIKSNGAVYTPHMLARFLTRKLVEIFLKDVNQEHKKRRSLKCSELNQIRILDPACGNGILLVSVFSELVEHLQSISKRPFPLRSLDPMRMLCGIDIDRKAIAKAKKNIGKLSSGLLKPRTKCNILNTNALFPFQMKNVARGWDLVKKRFFAESGFDLVIANPPWGADVSAIKNILSNGDYSLFRGQFDTSDLFIELSIKILKPGGFLAFIIPDSLFGQERIPLRRMLLEKTQVIFIGRFGEKIFPGINRSCAVIICKKETNNKKTNVSCFRLTPRVRKQILTGDITFADADKSLTHIVPQKRFQANQNFDFDIDIKVAEDTIFRKFRKCRGNFQHYLENYRGVELSKSGLVYQCESCGLWFPKPNSIYPHCPHCKSQVDILTHLVKSIVSNEYHEDYERILTGENIKRYQLSLTHWIDTQKEGINYKDYSIYSPPKLLLRKTGVGISAAVDYSNCMTNQVVYIFRPRKQGFHKFPIEFFEGVMNSRAIYYYLAKSYGETEWRSHPYLTQRQILDLPLPNQDELLNENVETIDQMAKLISPFAKKNEPIPAEIDARIERCVSSVYGLNKDDYSTIYSTLESVEELLPVRALKNVEIDEIFRY